MSYAPTAFRPMARGGWGGRAANHFRGLLTIDSGQGRGQGRGQVGTVIYRSPGAFVNFEISGVSRDSTGAVLGDCTIDLFQTGGDILTQSTVSNVSGNFSFSNPGTGAFYIVAYKTGSPDVAGTTVNTLYPTAV